MKMSSSDNEESVASGGETEEVVQSVVTAKVKKVKNKKSEEDSWIVSEKEKQLAALVFGDRDGLLENLEADNRKDEIPSKKRKVKKEAAWHDSDDETKPIEKKTINSKKRNLETKFERIVGKPKWADLDNIPEPDSDDDVLQTAGHIKSRAKDTGLRPNNLQMRILKDLNRVSYREGPDVSVLEFHPTSMVALVGGYGGIASLFAVDGQKNDKLHSLMLEKFNLSCAKFNKGGEEIIFGGNRRYFHNFNLMTTKSDIIRLPWGLKQMKKFQISPDGKYIVIADKFGQLVLLNALTKECVARFKQEHDVSDMTFTPDSQYIYSHSINSEVTIFDLRSTRMMGRFYDDGCIYGSKIVISPNSQLLATGSREGVVNIYNYEDVTKTETPQPIKRIMNLTTGIYCAQFNATSEILAISSKEIANATRLVHFPSATVFSNFPANMVKLGKTSALNFSPGGKYVAFGHDDRKVALFSLKHYPHY